MVKTRSEKGSLGMAIFWVVEKRILESFFRFHTFYCSSKTPFYDRRQRRPRNQDRQSGNPRTGRKAQEKKGGAGAGNWGKADENLDETAQEQVEKATPENAENAENPENAEDAE